MPLSKVVQAELTPEGSVTVTVQLSHLEAGEKALVTTTLVQPAATGDATLLVTGASPAGPQRVELAVTARTGAFTHAEPLTSFTQATTVWSTPLKPLPEATPVEGHPARLLWGDASTGWPGMD
jgi:hypothetical protein